MPTDFTEWDLCQDRIGCCECGSNKIMERRDEAANIVEYQCGECCAEWEDTIECDPPTK